MANPITAVVAFLAGFGVCLVITRRFAREVAPVRPEPPIASAEPVEAVASAEPVWVGAPGPARSPEVDLAVADAIFAVADRLTSTDLRQRLEQAASLLPDVTVLRPEPGTRFDPSRHEWVESRLASSPDTVETVAETVNAGLVDHHGTVLRPARVIAYDLPEE